MKNQLALLCGAGLALVSIPPIDGKPTKAPRAKGWNLPRSSNNPNGYSNNSDDFVNCEGFNFGLYHGASNTLALDLDDVELARKVFEDATNTQLLAWLEDDARVEVKSPKANRGKLLFKLPDGFDAGLRQLKHDKKVIFELRCGNCQDVIIGNHPEGGNYQLIGNPAAIPPAPPILLDLLQHWEDWKPCLDSALGIEQDAPKTAPRPQQQGEQLPGRRDPIQEFNQAFSVHDVLIRNGYKSMGKDRYIRPHSESKAPGVVILSNCADGIERAFSHGGDSLNDGFAHDAFDCFRLLEHDGDLNKALNWSPDITKSNQRLHMQGQADSVKQQAETASFDLSKFSLNGSSKMMREKMLNDVFVLPGIALLGNATVIYAAPNTGKTLLTLHLLIDGIKRGGVNGSDVFYINADDTYRGLIEKLELAEQHKFHMLAPGHYEFEAKQLPGYLSSMIANDDARGKVLILDTVKKFTSLMDKNLGTEFMKVAREFVSKGGTLIMLAHVNKHKDADGKSVHAGTTDLVDDGDCAYMLDVAGTTDKTKSVLFSNFKARGDVASELGFTYSIVKGQSYFERLQSVEPLNEQQRVEARQAQAIAARMEKDSSAIEAILEVLSQTDMPKTDLVLSAHNESGISKVKLNKVLSVYCGSDFSRGHRWCIIPSVRNAKIYSRLNQFQNMKQATADDYKSAKGL
jgi:hypothetical protein